MIACLSNYSPRLAGVLRRSEYEEDQLRWEEKIRTTTTRKVVSMVPPAQPPCPPTRLELASRVSRRDLLLIPRTLPALTGAGPANLVCGECCELIGAGLTCRTARREHPEGSRLVIRCTCGALNLISSEQGLGD